MKATDLMIGDWLRYSPKSISLNNNYGGPYRVEGVSQDTISLGTKNYRFVVSDKEIDSIPLTPEILEKNGIKKRRDEYAVFGWEGMKQWYVTLEDFKPQYDFWFITSSDRDLNISGQIRYVHQLQHALRICGLDELADNFKI